MFKGLINAFYPPVCIACGNVIEETGLCKECKRSVRLVTGATCTKCGKALLVDGKLLCNDCAKRTHYFEKNVILFEYMGEMKESIYRFKYKNARVYAEYFARVAKARYGNLLYKWNIDTIVAVPMYNKKEIHRGYNQAEEFAERLGQQMGIKIDKDFIKRSKDTVPMKELSSEMRYENLKKVFSVNTEKIGLHKNVLLVDDIYTTGATLDACARVMLKAGVRTVYGMCIAGGRDNKN